MKKLLFVLVSALLFACVDYTDDFETIDVRLDNLEQTLPSVAEQIDWLNESVSSLKQVDSDLARLIEELAKRADSNAAELAALNEYDKVIDAKIAELGNATHSISEDVKTVAAAAAETLSLLQSTRADLEAVNAAVSTLATDLSNLANEINGAMKSLETSVNTAIKQLNAKITELENRLKIVEDKVEALLARIQSVSYIPQFSDGATEMYHINGKTKVELDFKISPKECVADLAKVWQSALSCEAVHTRAVSLINMPVVSFSADEKQGVITVEALAENLSDAYLNEEIGMNIALVISDGNNSITSDYVCVYPPAIINVDALSVEVPGYRGTFAIGYTITNRNPDLINISTSADWLHLKSKGWNYQNNRDEAIFSYDAQSPNSPSREAVIVFSYEGKIDPVVVTVKQSEGVSTFAVTFDEASLTCGYAAYSWTITNTEMTYVMLSTQDFGNFGIAGETPEEQLTNYISTLAGYGMLTEEYAQWGYWYKGAPEEGMYKEAYRYDAKESVQVYAVGFSAEDTGEIDPNYETPIYKVTLLTPVHAWDVPFKPYPAVVVAESDMVKNVTSAAGEVVIDCVVENPLEGETVLCQTEASWVKPSWSNNKLTLTYEANTTAVSRRAKIAIQYGYYTNPFEVTLVQEKDPNAVATTLEVKITGSTFNGIWVDVTPSDANALYALDTTTPETNWETGAEIAMDWATVAENLLSYVPSTTTFHKGALKGHFIKMNPSNYEWYGLDYYVYAVAVDAVSEEGTDWQGNPKTTWTVNGILSEVYYDRTTIDNSKTPSVEWDLTKNPELVWNEGNERYDLDVVEGTEVVLHFIVKNPAEGAFLTLNGTTLYDSYNVVDGEPVVDNAAGTVTIKIDKFDESKRYHYVLPSFKYINAEGDTWGITTPTLRITQIQKAE